MEGNLVYVTSDLAEEVADFPRAVIAVLDEEGIDQAAIEGDLERQIVWHSLVSYCDMDTEILCCQQNNRSTFFRRYL
jgi:hypothetical protein